MTQRYKNFYYKSLSCNEGLLVPGLDVLWKGVGVEQGGARDDSHHLQGHQLVMAVCFLYLVKCV